MLGFFFRNFSHFWGVFTHLGFFHRFFRIFARFLKVWEGFWEDFETIFRLFFLITVENDDVLKSVVLP